MEAEVVARVSPGFGWTPARGAGKCLEFGDRIFVRVLSVDALAFGEAEFPAEHAHCLAYKAHEMHLDAA